MMPTLWQEFVYPWGHPLDFFIAWGELMTIYDQWEIMICLTVIDIVAVLALLAPKPKIVQGMVTIDRLSTDLIDDVFGEK